MTVSSSSVNPINQTATAGRFFDGRRAALTCIQQALEPAQYIRIATAYFEGSGFQELQHVLTGKRLRLLVGRNEGGEDSVKEVLREFIRELSYGTFKSRTTAMHRMLEALENGWMTVSVGTVATETLPVVDARYLFHHAKLYIADETAVVVTSANFSRQGLCVSREAGVTIVDADDVEFFVRRFDTFFEEARSITAELITALQAWLEAYDPYIIYARALLELYDLPSDEAPAQLPPLAKYQESVASSVLRALLEHDGAFLVASTGLGKTVIAAHVAAYLRMHNEIDNALVICPAGLREVWRRSMRAARVPSVEFSYHTLRRTDGDANLPILEHELRQTTEQTLIILDESHRLRNENADGGDIRLSNQRIQNVVREQNAKILLLTATPYGKDFSEVDAQLRLLPLPKKLWRTPIGLSVEMNHWQVEKLVDLAEIPPATVLTTPDVVRHFGQQDKDGERYVVFRESDRRYFPRRIRLQTVRYENPFDEFLADLFESKLLYKQDMTSEMNGQLALPIDPDSIAGIRLPLQEALFLHQFCSSPAEVDRVCALLEQGGYNYEFARQTELRDFVRARRKNVQRVLKRRKNDDKLNTLARIIREHKGEKTVVFCEYRETARYLRDGLAALLPNLSVEMTVDAQNLDDLLKRFAPIANEVLPEERDSTQEINVLVASRAMAEGFNLQDANILVNYDLPWTVLQLAQRMGRILRPWHEPRDVTIYNFVPSTMNHERIRHARNWEQRLKERSRQHRSLAQIPVLVHKEARENELEQALEMEKLGREMFLASDETEMDLGEVLEFIQSVDDLTTSTFYNDLAKITRRAEILALPAGIRSARKTKGNRRLFLLLRHRQKRIDTIIVDARGNLLEDSWHRDEVMRSIRCVEGTPKAPFESYPTDDEFDEWIDVARQRWAEEIGVEPTHLQVICALAMV